MENKIIIFKQALFSDYEKSSLSEKELIQRVNIIWTFILFLIISNRLKNEIDCHSIILL
jgi:hypothetical protein